MPLIHASLTERTAYHESGHVVAELRFGIPILSVAIDCNTPAMHRGKYHAPHDLGLEVMTTLCLSGPAAEELFCGPIEDGSNQADIEMARRYLSRRFDPLRIGAALARHADAADRLVRTGWAQDRIRLIAAALLKHGSLSGDDIFALLP